MAGALDLRDESSLANTYEGVLLAVIAVLAVGQWRWQPCGERWLWRVGWLSVALIAALAAVVEIVGGVDIGHATHTALTTVPSWTAQGIALLAIPLVAIVARLLWVSQRKHPALLLLTVLAVVLAVGSVLLDAYDGVWPDSRSRAAADLLEEGMELMAAALFAVVLAETLGHAATNH